MDKFDIGSQWKTRGGCRAVIVGLNTNFEDDTHAFFACRDGAHGYFETIRYTSTGDVYLSECDKNKYDLIEPWKDHVVHEGWVNIYRQVSDRNLGYHFHETRANADKCASCVVSRIACIKIEFPEGKGL